jgi:DNA-binding NtrC family response regulator
MDVTVARDSASMVSRLFRPGGMTAGRGAPPDHDLGRRAVRPRRRDRRSGVAVVIAQLSAHLAAAGPGRLRATFEEALTRVLSMRYVRLSIGQAIATGDGPVVRDRGVVVVPVTSGLAILEAAPLTARPLDEWEWQTLSASAQLAALVIEIERAQSGARPGALMRGLPCGLVGSSAPMKALRERIQRVARREVPVLVEGESGVGKELVARQIHELSPRARGAFVAVNCAALVESLLEAELFGIEDRTATGVRGRRGKFEIADGGTLFLDEIADLSPHAQAKLLRVIQEGAVERVGGHGSHRVDVRLVAATNRSLQELVQQGRFRVDLFYRLNGVEIQVPALRSRREDIPELIEFFLGAQGEGQRVRLTAEALDALLTHEWPGNVRELARVLERAVTLSDDNEIALHHLPAAVAANHHAIVVPSLERRETLRSWGSRYARLVLRRCGNNKREACRVLGITYHTLQAYLRHAEQIDAGAAEAAADHRHHDHVGKSAGST